MKVKVLHNQTIFDIALQHTGSIESAFEILINNNKNVIEVIQNEELNISEIVNKKIQEYYLAKSITIASKDYDFMSQHLSDFDNEDFDFEDFG